MSKFLTWFLSVAIAFLLFLLTSAGAHAQSLPVVDTGWVACNAETASDLTYPALIAVSPDPCRELVVHTVSLQYRYTGEVRVHANSPAPCYATGGGGTVIYWTGAHPNTTYDYETGIWSGDYAGLVYSVQAGGGTWSTSCVQPGASALIDDVTSFSNVGAQYAPCVSNQFPIVGERRGLLLARLWFTPQYRENGTGWYWGWQWPVPPGSWGSHSPMQYVENPVEARAILAYEWR